MKFLSRISGRAQEVIATVVSAGASDAGDIVALDPDGKLDPSVMPVGFGQNTKVLPASETLAANDLVSVWNDAGTAKVRKADGTTTGKEVHGFVKAGVASGANATVYLPGNSMTGLTGLTPGARQYLSTSPGLLTETPLEANGNISQLVGIALTATEVAFEPEEPITVAA